MAQLELVPKRNADTCWFCEENPASTTRKSIVTGTHKPCCAECVEIAQILTELDAVVKTPISLTDVCLDILVSPFRMRGGKLDS